jgi:hypothetical protein
MWGRISQRKLCALVCTMSAKKERVSGRIVIFF